MSLDGRHDRSSRLRRPGALDAADGLLLAPLTPLRFADERGWQIHAGST